MTTKELTKQEEIREILEGIGSGGLSIDEGLRELDIVGVVIKVEGELPKNPHLGCFDRVNKSYPQGIPQGYHILRDAGNEEGYAEAQEDMAGYVATIPIKDNGI